MTTVSAHITTVPLTLCFRRLPALADLLFTQQGLVLPQAECILLLSAGSCDSTHHGLHCSRLCLHTSQHVAASPFSCVCLRYLSVLRWKNSPTAPHCGITLTTRVSGPQHYIVSNSYKLVQAPRRPLASTQGSNGTTSSDFVSSPQLPHSAISSQVPAGPTRNVTGDAMSATLAEAATQLPFAEFLQRCNFLRAAQPHPTSGRSCADSFTQRCFC